MLTNYNIKLENLTILLMYEHELSHFITSTSFLYDNNPVQSFLVLQLENLKRKDSNVYKESWSLNCDINLVAFKYKAAILSIFLQHSVYVLKEWWQEEGWLYLEVLISTMISWNLQSTLVYNGNCSPIHFLHVSNKAFCYIMMNKICRNLYRHGDITHEVKYRLKIVTISGSHIWSVL